MSQKFLDLSGLTAYDKMLKEWFKSGVVDITDEEIKALFAASAYQMVDLGLPSGLKWADRNVGAETPQDNGLYFSWGNVDGHAVDENGNVTDGYSFDYRTYRTTLGGQYTGNTLDMEHDAATVNMGSDWRMPTVDETTELIENTVHYYIDNDGNIVAGPFEYGVRSSDKGLDGSKLRSICFVKKGEVFDYNVRDNFIEFKFAGYCQGSFLTTDGFNSFVWSNSLPTDNLDGAYGFNFSSDGLVLSSYNGINGRSYGVSVRGVHA